MTKKLIEGQDYFLHFVRLANKANPAIAVLNDDGTVDIYLNTLFDEFACADALPHEFIHIAEDHLYMDLPVSSLESAAERRKCDVKITSFGAVVAVKNMERRNSETNIYGNS